MDFAILGPLRVVGPDGPIELTAAKQRALLATLLLAHREQAVSPDAADRRAVGRGPACDGRQGAPGPRLAAAAARWGRATRSSPTRRATRSRSDPASSTSSASRRSSRRRARSARPAGCRRPRGCCGRRSSCSAARRSSTRRCSGRRRSRPTGSRRCGSRRSRSGSTWTSRSAATPLLVDELETLATEHPYRERLHAQLMLALYRAGRQADALAALPPRRAARSSEDLGLEPGRELQRLEAAILAQDAELDAPAAPAAAPADARPPLPRAADAAARARGGGRCRDGAARGARRAPAHGHRARRDGEDAPGGQAVASQVREQFPDGVVLRRPRGDQRPDARRLGDRARGGCGRRRGRRVARSRSSSST